MKIIVSSVNIQKRFTELLLLREQNSDEMEQSLTDVLIRDGEITFEKYPDLKPIYVEQLPNNEYGYNGYLDYDAIRAISLMFKHISDRPTTIGFDNDDKLCILNLPL